MPFWTLANTKSDNHHKEWNLRKLVTCLNDKSKEDDELATVTMIQIRKPVLKVHAHTHTQCAYVKKAHSNANVQQLQCTAAAMYTSMQVEVEG